MPEDARDKEQSEYNSTYYERHRQELLDKKRQRYREDPEYRRKLVDSAVARKKRLREENPPTASKEARRGPMKPKLHRIDLNGASVDSMMLSAGQLGKALGRTLQTIRNWEKKGILPEAMYRTERGVRLYTEFQVKKLKEAMEQARQKDGAMLVRERIASTVFPELARQVWRDFPVGVDPNQV